MDLPILDISYKWNYIICDLCDWFFFRHVFRCIYICCSMCQHFHYSLWLNNTWVQLFVTLWTIALQTPLSMGLSRQEYWSGCHFLLQGIFLSQESNQPLYVSFIGRRILSILSHLGNPEQRFLSLICVT